MFDYIKHHDYVAPKFFDDICLLYLMKPFDIDGYVGFLPLATKTPYYGALCNVSGWGSIKVRLFV